MEPPSAPSPRSSPLNLTVGDGIALGSAVIAAAIGIGQWTSAAKAADLQRQQNSVQIAVGVLSQKSPRSPDGKSEKFPQDEQALRRWAVSVLNESSDGKIQDIEGQAAMALIEGETALRYGGYDYDMSNVLRNSDGTPILNSDGTPLSN